MLNIEDIKLSILFLILYFLLQHAMASSLDSLVGHNIMVVTTDGRCFHGTLKGFDQTINLILDQSHERVYSADEGKLDQFYP